MMICSAGARPVYIAPVRFGWNFVYQLPFTFATRSYHKLNTDPIYFFRYGLRAFRYGLRATGLADVIVFMGINKLQDL